MKYEKPILEIMELENKDIVCTSKTPGYEWGGDNDEDFVQQERRKAMKIRDFLKKTLAVALVFAMLAPIM